MTDDRGRNKPTKRQVRTEKEVGPEADGSGPRARTARKLGVEPAENSVETRSRNLPRYSPFFSTFRWMCRFGGGGYREEFWPWVESRRKGAEGVVRRVPLFAVRCT